MGSGPLHFAPPRPSGEAAASWSLPAGSLSNGSSEVCRALVSLYMSSGGGPLELKASPALLLLVKAGAATYEFKVCTREKVLVSQPLLPSLTFYFRPSTHTLVWNMSVAGSVHVLLACFARDDEEETLKEFWTTSYMESGAASAHAGKMAEGDRRWAVQASDAMDVDAEEEARDADEWDLADEEDHLPTDNLTAESSIRMGGDAGRAAAAEAAAAASSSSGPRNDNLAVGMALNRTFVNRGAQIGVFKHDAHGALQYLNNIPLVKDMSGHAFAPSKMMLHQEDGKMMLLNPDNKDTVYEMDLECKRRATGMRMQQRSGARRDCFFLPHQLQLTHS